MNSFSRQSLIRTGISCGRRRPSSASSLLLLLLLAALLVSGCTPLKEVQAERIKEFRTAVSAGKVSFPVPPGTKVDSVAIDDQSRLLTVLLSKEFSYEPFRPANVRKITSDIQSYFSEQFEGYGVTIQTLNRRLDELIPNYYRTDPARIDRARLPRSDSVRPAPVVQNISRPFVPHSGLSARNIVLWHSHGWYFDKSDDRWEWQRPRLFQTVEDLVPMSFTIPYLVPMLENAGATVFLPRERDLQSHEVVIDNDNGGKGYLESSTSPALRWGVGSGPGFSRGTVPYTNGYNPFLWGTHRVIPGDTAATATATWIPEIPDTGSYAVYVSYHATPDNVEDARYTVFHRGGRTEFVVNQQICGGTWVYLGTFLFAGGSNPATGRVVLTNLSKHAGKTISADAVRFGGGTGVVARNGRTSGRPKFVEGARYYLQYAGMPDTLVWGTTRGRDDYADDYVSRPEYANYLRGAPSGPNKDRKARGLGVPVDLTLAFHTDAGITRNDTTIGTLSIFSTLGADTAAVFPDSVSRMASRDFADILQTQIVDDIRATYDPSWTRRQLMDASRYAEARLPNVPGALLELLSHQNFLDMRYTLDPGFRFTAARAIYKAMLRFLAYQNGTPAIVQPLPPDHMSTEFTPEGHILVRWRPVDDPLEPTAGPGGYIVYTRIGDGGFDNGTFISEPSFLRREVLPGVMYSFRVTAVNDGGESFPGETLAACRVDSGRATAMIINGFDRVSGPRWVQTSRFSGFLNNLDAGVPDRTSINFTGIQYDFNPASPYMTNDAPGYGASEAYNEGKVIAGNMFDYPFLHGSSLRAAGISFVSASRAAVVDTMVPLRPYRLVDLILGKQRTTAWQKSIVDSLRGPRFTAFPSIFRERLAEYCREGGNLFVTGAFVASDLAQSAVTDTTAKIFAGEVLKFGLGSAHASRGGAVFSVQPTFMPREEWTAFRGEPSREMYGLESVDALAPVPDARVILRYAENEFCAGVAYKGRHGVVGFGFPFEAIPDGFRRDAVMKAVVGFLLGQ
jgi:hypothetical protein